MECEIRRKLRVRDDRRRMKWKRKRRREIIRDMERWNIKHVAICLVVKTGLFVVVI